MAMGRLGLENFPRSVSSSIFCMDLLSALNNARFKFQGSGSNTLEVMSICLNHIKLKQGRIHGNPVADGWAGAVLRKPLEIQKCDGPTDGRTDRHGKV